MPVRQIKVLGVPIDLGGAHRGVDMGPSALRVAGLVEDLRALGYSVLDLGNVPVPVPQSVGHGDPRARYLNEITEVCADVAARVEQGSDAESSFVVLGGDHSAAVGSVSGTAAAHAKRGQRIGLIWIDAHTDMNTPDSSPTGNIHGMPVACLIGHGPPPLTIIGGPAPRVLPKNVVFIGIRSVDPTEKELVRNSGVHVFTMRDVDELGARGVMERAIALACDGTAGFHFSFDMDGVDSQVAPGVGTPVRGGLSYRESHLIAEMAHDSGRMLAMDMMEVDPVEDVRNQTARLGVELILSAHGKSIL
ncbi:MAG: arginase [Planctomycetes bacterium]|nr:arginase [Planctomycetota bacterium]